MATNYEVDKYFLAFRDLTLFLFLLFLLYFIVKKIFSIFQKEKEITITASSTTSTGGVIPSIGAITSSIGTQLTPDIKKILKWVLIIVGVLTFKFWFPLITKSFKTGTVESWKVIKQDVDIESLPVDTAGAQHINNGYHITLKPGARVRVTVPNKPIWWRNTTDIYLTNSTGNNTIHMEPGFVYMGDKHPPHVIGGDYYIYSKSAETTSFNIDW